MATTKLQMTYRKVQKANSAAEAVEAKIEAACEELDGKEKVEMKASMKAELHKRMDEQLDERKERLEKAEEGKDTTAMLKLITASLEAAFVQYLELGKNEAKKMRGRATVTIKREEIKPDMKPIKEADAEVENGGGEQVSMRSKRTGSNMSQSG